MRPGLFVIRLIVQELWIKTLEDNELGRSRPRVWPAAGPGRAEEVSRIGAHAAVRHKAGAIEYRTKQLSSA